MPCRQAPPHKRNAALSLQSRQAAACRLVEPMTEPVPPQDLYTSGYGGRQAQRKHWRSRRYGRIVDRLFDLRLQLNGSFRKLPTLAAQVPQRRVLVTSVDVPARRAGLDAMLAALRRTRHDVTVHLSPLGDRGKFENINVAMAGMPLDGFDWLIVVDDDISFREGFLDQFLFVAEAVRFRICQPAHLFHSYTSWQVTQRAWNGLAHATQFVECGPMTAFHHSVFADCLPFPETRWAWGIDVLWSEIACRGGFEIGVIDATPIEHLREVADSYSREDAITEANDLLERFGARRDARDIMVTDRVIRHV